MRLFVAGPEPAPDARLSRRDGFARCRKGGPQRPLVPAVPAVVFRYGDLRGSALGRSKGKSGTLGGREGGPGSAGSGRHRLRPEEILPARHDRAQGRRELEAGPGAQRGYDGDAPLPYEDHLSGREAGLLGGMPDRFLSGSLLMRDPRGSAHSWPRGSCLLHGILQAGQQAVIWIHAPLRPAAPMKVSPDRPLHAPRRTESSVSGQSAQALV